MTTLSRKTSLLFLLAILFASFLIAPRTSFAQASGWRTMYGIKMYRTGDEGPFDSMSYRPICNESNPSIIDMLSRYVGHCVTAAVPNSQQPAPSAPAPAPVAEIAPAPVYVQPTEYDRSPSGADVWMNNENYGYTPPPAPAQTAPPAPAPAPAPALGSGIEGDWYDIPPQPAVPAQRSIESQSPQPADPEQSWSGDVQGSGLQRVIGASNLFANTNVQSSEPADTSQSTTNPFSALWSGLRSIFGGGSTAQPAPTSVTPAAEVTPFVYDYNQSDYQSGIEYNTNMPSWSNYSPSGYGWDY